MPTVRALSPRTAVRRFNGLVLKFSRDLLGSRPALTTVEREMVRQTASMLIRAQQLQAAVIQGEPVDGDELIRTSSEARRLACMLGLKIEHAPSAKPSHPIGELRARYGEQAHG
jgi:hypothetical protein